MRSGSCWGPAVLVGSALLVAVVSCRHGDRPRVAISPAGPAAHVTTSAPTSEPAEALDSSVAKSALLFSSPPAPARNSRKPDEVTYLNRDCIACHSSSDSISMHSPEIV